MGIISWVILRPRFRRASELSYSIYMVHVLVIVLLTNVFVIAEKLTRLKLRSDFVIDGQHYIGIGTSPWQGDLAYVFLLALVIVASACTFRFIETPWREHSRRLVAFGTVQLRRYARLLDGSRAYLIAFDALRPTGLRPRAWSGVTSNGKPQKRRNDARSRTASATPVGECVPLLQQQDLDHRQWRISRRAPNRRIDREKKLSNAGESNVLSIRSRNPPLFPQPFTIASTNED